MTVAVDAQRQTLASFDWQWAQLSQGDFRPGDPWFDAHAVRVLARELCAIDEQWFAGKRVLDAGCGQGRWTRALLELRAEVIAVDYSEAGLDRTRALCADGGSTLLAPIAAADVERVVRGAGAREVEFRPAVPRAVLIAHFPE